MKLESLISKYEPLNQAAIEVGNKIISKCAEVERFIHRRTPINGGRSQDHLAALNEAIEDQQRYTEGETAKLKELRTQLQALISEVSTANNKKKGVEDELAAEVNKQGLALDRACSAKGAETANAIQLALEPFFIRKAPPVSEIASQSCVVQQIEQDSRSWRSKRTDFEKAKALIPLLKKYNL